MGSEVFSPQMVYDILVTENESQFTSNELQESYSSSAYHPSNNGVLKEPFERSMIYQVTAAGLCHIQSAPILVLA